VRCSLLVEEFGQKFRYIKGKHNLISGALSRLEMEPLDSQYKPTPQFMAATLTRTECILDELDPDLFENAKNFGESTEERTDYTFPVDTSYIA
jgi:hypothetical protein